MGQTPDTAWFDEIYRLYNKRALAWPDPIVFLYDYPDVRDREIVALVASALAYGRVKQILASVEKVLVLMRPSPVEFLKHVSNEKLWHSLAGFKHRFTTGEEVAALLAGAKSALENFGSLEKCFLDGFDKNDTTIASALATFAEGLGAANTGKHQFPLFPSPANGGACKRPMLFMRWMVRHDDVDPGGWENVPTSKLVVPIDTHMRKIAHRLGLTSRKTVDLKLALETTQAFAEINPDDPVQYDFALTRFGIRDDMTMDALPEKQPTPPTSTTI